MDDERLISEVKEHPCLYNTKSADYKVLLKKENAWKAIAAALGEHISVEECTKRWKALRERFAREAKKKKKKKSGDAADNTPTWPYYDQLLFLIDFVKHRKTAGNVDAPIVVEEEGARSDYNREEQEEELDSSADVSLESSRASTPHASASTSSASTSSASTSSASTSSAKWSKPCKRKRAAMDEVDAEILRQLGTMKEPEADEDSLFAQSIAASLKRMGPQKKSLAKIKIQQALFEVEFAPPHPLMLPPPSTYPPFAANYSEDI